LPRIAKKTKQDKGNQNSQLFAQLSQLKLNQKEKRKKIPCSFLGITKRSMKTQTESFKNRSFGKEKSEQPKGSKEVFTLNFRFDYRFVAAAAVYKKERA
jgi:hypothetical protein